jgi:predicted kinase
MINKDRIQQTLVERQGVSGSNREGYFFLFDLAEVQLRLGVDVLLDAVFPRNEYRDRVRRIASRYGARFKVALCSCSDDSAWESRFYKDQASRSWAKGYDWQCVLRARQRFEPWRDVELLALDSAAPREGNLERLTEWLVGGTESRCRAVVSSLSSHVSRAAAEIGVDPGTPEIRPVHNVIEG